jgi:heme/copper-type cytochrome/quinol oxidase subunit 3
VKHNVARDLSGLPTWGFGPTMTMWWGTGGFVLIETTAFALVTGAYLYLHQINRSWPLSAAPPDLAPGTLVTLILIASLAPNIMARNAALAQRKGAVQVLLVIMSLVGVAIVAVRFYELTHLRVSWDENAYGSIVWLILGLHTFHLITDLGDTIVLTALFFTRHAHGRRFSDVEDNAFYWNFVVLAWIPLYALIYWLPRW